MSSTSGDDSDAGAPLPDFRTTGLQLQTIAPALGVPTQQAQPDYLDYDPKGRGIVVTMFANSGMAYLLGIGGGGVYGFRQGLASTPSNRFRVQLNSILNHSGRYGSRAGNTLGVFAVFYSIFEGLADQNNLEDLLGVRAVSPAAASMVAPAFGATTAGALYFAPAGPRVAALAGALGFGSVAATYGLYTVLGIPYGSRGFLFL